MYLFYNTKFDVRRPKADTATPFQKFVLNMRLLLKLPTVLSALSIVNPLLNRTKENFVFKVMTPLKRRNIHMLVVEQTANVR